MSRDKTEIPQELAKGIFGGTEDEVVRVWEDGVNHTIECVKNLNERDRVFVSLYYYEQLPLLTVADVLGIDEDNIVKLKDHILKQLYDCVLNRCSNTSKEGG